MAKKVSIINMKGGVGKSTLAVNLAWFFAEYKLKKVLIVDLDPQFNASQYLMGVWEYERILQQGLPTIWDLFEQHTLSPLGKIGDLDIHTAIYNRANYGSGKIDLIPSRLELAFSVKNPGQKEKELAQAIEKLENEYDLIILDCPPSESFLTTAAYLASDYVLVPVKPEYLSSIGLPLLGNSLNEFKECYKTHDLVLAGVVFNVTENYSPEENLSKVKVRQVADQNGWYVFNAEVPKSKSFPTGARLGLPISNTPYSRSKQISRFFAFAREFAERISL